MPRLAVTKTFKLYIKGVFPRSESGRSLRIDGTDGEVLAHICHASRKDLRDAVDVARKAQPAWAARTAYNRGQILYRMAEMLEGKRREFISLLTASGAHESDKDAAREVEAAVDRLVSFAGWTDKYQQLLGCSNPVAGPYYNFTVPEPTGTIVVVAPDAPSLLGLISLLAPPVSAGNAVVCVASDEFPLAAAVLGEVCATSDVPAGVINILTGQRAELLEHIAGHRGVDAISAANLEADQAITLRKGAAENIKRVHVAEYADDDWLDVAIMHSPWMIDPFVEAKTIWHPSSC